MCCIVPSDSDPKSIASPIRMLMTPRKPWSFFLNFFWSNTCTARILSSLTRLRGRRSVSHRYPRRIIVRLLGYVQIKALIPVWVQRPFRHGRRLGLLAIDGCYGERVGKSYAKRRVSQPKPLLLVVVGRERTKHISLIQAIGGDD